MAINTDELAKAFQAFVAANPDLLTGGREPEAPAAPKDPTPTTGFYDLLRGLVGYVAGADNTRRGELLAAIDAHEAEHDELAKPVRDEPADDGGQGDEPAAAAPVAPGISPEI